MLLFPDLPSLKLVEPGRDEGVVRVETMVRVSGVLGSGSGYRVPVVVSTQPFASLTCWLNQLQRGGVRVLAQLASGGGKLVEPACSLFELAVSKPSRACPKTRCQVLTTGCQGFRFGPLLRRSPAQPALPGSHGSAPVGWRACRFPKS